MKLTEEQKQIILDYIYGKHEKSIDLEYIKISHYLDYSEPSITVVMEPKTTNYIDVMSYGNRREWYYELQEVIRRINPKYELLISGATTLVNNNETEDIALIEIIESTF